MPEVILILVIALVVFGPKQLPEVGKALGKTLNEFRRASMSGLAEVPEAIREAKEDSAQQSAAAVEEKPLTRQNGSQE
jgi:sec-independent protein translocase protein TatA